MSHNDEWWRVEHWTIGGGTPLMCCHSHHSRHGVWNQQPMGIEHLLTNQIFSLFSLAAKIYFSNSSLSHFWRHLPDHNCFEVQKNPQVTHFLECKVCLQRLGTLFRRFLSKCLPMHNLRTWFLVRWKIFPMSSTAPIIIHFSSKTWLTFGNKLNTFLCAELCILIKNSMKNAKQNIKNNNSWKLMGKRRRKRNCPF